MPFYYILLRSDAFPLVPPLLARILCSPHTVCRRRHPSSNDLHNIIIIRICIENSDFYCYAGTGIEFFPRRPDEQSFVLTRCLHFVMILYCSLYLHALFTFSFYCAYYSMNAYTAKLSFVVACKTYIVLIMIISV